MCLDRLDFREKFLLLWLHWAGEQFRAEQMLSLLPKDFAQVLQLYNDGKCTELCRTKRFFSKKFSGR